MNDIKPPSEVETAHEIKFIVDIGHRCVCLCVEESTSSFRILGALSEEPPLFGTAGY